MWLENTALIVVFLVFLTAAYFFAYAESATIAAQRIMIAHAAREGDPRARLVEAFRNNPRRFFGTTLIGTNICIVTMSAVGAHELLPNLGVHVVLATIVVDVFILVIAEITPKTLSLSNPTASSLKVAGLLEITAKILTPAIWLLTYGPSRVLNIDKAFHAHDDLMITEKEIVHMIGVSAKEGSIERNEGERAVKVLKFADTTVENVMTPRADMVFLRTGDTLRKALSVANATGFSRLPVLDAAGEECPGFIAAKDILRFDLEGRLDESVGHFLRPIKVVPDTKRILRLLEEFRNRGEQIAVVVNEFGAITGVVSLEDLLEEVLGEIYDEYDPDAPTAEWVGESLYIPGAYPARKLADRLKVTMPPGDYNTAAGLFLHLLGFVPKPGEKVSLDGWELVATHVVRNRIARLTAHRRPK
jgi:CBS domain containing-hemolysin-like protein